MKDNLGLYFWATLISAILGAITPILVEIYKEWRNSLNKKKKKPSIEQKERPIEGKEQKRKRIANSILGVIVGVAVGFLAAFLIVRFCNTSETVLWDFNDGIKDWTYFGDPQDASKSVDPGEDTELGAGVLVVKFNFAQVDLNALPANMAPRATVWADNQNMDWTGYTKLLLDVKNVDSQLLEMTFSIYADGCFYEFSGYKSLSQNANWETIDFLFTEPKYKTCISPDEKRSPANFVGIEQFYIIISTNADRANLENEVHSIFIDNIRLQK